MDFLDIVWILLEFFINISILRIYWFIVIILFYHLLHLLLLIIIYVLLIQFLFFLLMILWIFWNILTILYLVNLICICLVRNILLNIWCLKRNIRLLIIIFLINFFQFFIILFLWFLNSENVFHFLIIQPYKIVKKLYVFTFQKRPFRVHFVQIILEFFFEV